LRLYGIIYENIKDFNIKAVHIGMLCKLVYN
jgi:hypothetical protein